MKNFTQEEINKITDEVFEIARIQALAYKQGYQKGFEDGKKKAVESVVKVYEEDEEVPQELKDAVEAERWADNL